MKIIFICTGNTCRSVMAQGLLQKMWEETIAAGGSGTLQVESAGVAAFPGQQATPEALTVLDEEGIDLLSHRSRPVSGGLLAEADLILAMTCSQKAMLLRQYPDYSDKIQLFSFYCLGVEEDIPDPYGHPGSYPWVASRLKEGLARLLELLQAERAGDAGGKDTDKQKGDQHG